MPNYASWPMNVCQIGKETTPGTSVACTTIWRGPFGGFDDDRTSETIEEDTGTYADTGRTVDTMYGIKIPVPQGTLHYEQLLYLAEGTIAKSVVPTGTPPTYVRTYNVAVGDTAPSLQAYTFRVGNKLVSADMALLSYVLCEEWEISGNQGELWKCSSNWMAPRKQSGSFTAALAIPAWEPMNFSNSKLYIDAVGGTIGTTQKLGVLMGFSMKYTTGVEWVPAGDGTLYAIAHKVGKPAITFTLTLEVEDGGVVAAERAIYESKAFRLIRIQCPGLSPRDMALDIYGQYTKVGPYTKLNQNNTTVTFEGKAVYEPTAAKTMALAVTTNLATIT
jgi:hypothetical protein